MNPLPCPSPRLARTVAVWLALAAVPALAHDLPAPLPSGEDAPPWASPPRVVPAAEPATARPQGLVRVLGELGGGALLGAGLGVGAAALGDAACRPSPGDAYGCMGPVFGAGLLGAAVGFPLGVWGGGKLLGGQGSLLATYAGAAAGTAILVAGMAATSSSPTPLPVVMGLSLLAVPFTTIVAFELSDRAALSEHAPAAAHVAPSVSLSSSGASVGLQGYF